MSGLLVTEVNARNCNNGVFCVLCGFIILVEGKLIMKLSIEFYVNSHESKRLSLTKCISAIPRILNRSKYKKSPPRH